jgi:hypothetical protein
MLARKLSKQFKNCYQTKTNYNVIFNYFCKSTDFFLKIKK